MAFSLSTIGNQGNIPSYADVLAAANNLQPYVTSLSSSGVTDTLTSQQMLSGVFVRSGATAAVTATTDTAALIYADMTTSGGAPAVGSTFMFFYTNQNTSAGAVTLVGGAGVALTGSTVIPVGGTRLYIGTVLTPTSIQLNGAVNLSGNSSAVTEANTTITTAGNGALTAAGIAGRLITRSGPTVAYNDTTATASQIVAAVPGAVAGQSFEIEIINTVAFPDTLAGGSGVTLSGLTVIPPLSALRALVTITSLTAVSIYGISTAAIAYQPDAFWADVNSTSTALNLTAAQVSGGKFTILNRRGTLSGAGADTLPTVAALVAAIPNAAINQSYILRYVNNSTSQTITVTTNTGWTLNGTMTVANNTTRDFIVTLTSLSAATLQQIGVGTTS